MKRINCIFSDLIASICRRCEFHFLFRQLREEKNVLEKYLINYLWYLVISHCNRSLCLRWRCVGDHIFSFHFRLKSKVIFDICSETRLFEQTCGMMGKENIINLLCMFVGTISSPLNRSQFINFRTKIDGRNENWRKNAMPRQSSLLQKALYFPNIFFFYGIIKHLATNFVTVSFLLLAAYISNLSILYIYWNWIFYSQVFFHCTFSVE